MKGFGIEIKNNLLENKHYQSMGIALWFYLWLIDKVTSITEDGKGRILGGKPIKLEDVQRDFDISPDTYTDWMKKLLAYPYIEATRTPHGHVFMVLKIHKRFGSKLEHINRDSVKKRIENPLKSGVRLRQIAESNKTVTVDSTVDSNNNSAAAKEAAEVEAVEKAKSGVEILVDRFFELKGWDGLAPEEFKKRQIVYGRHVRPAKQLLTLCDGDVAEATRRLTVIRNWADAQKIEWGIETTMKRWNDIDTLPQEAEKKAYIDGDRAYQKNGSWYVIISTGEHKEYIGPLAKLEYR